MTANVFISFASQDRKVALTLCSALENRGFQCWISARDIQPGENFQTAIVKAIRQAKIMLLVFTANSNTSEEMTKELALASQFKVMVVPLRIEDVAPSDAFAYEFATRQWIDFFSDWELAIQQLSRRIEYAVTQPAAAAKLAQAADADILEMAPPVAKEKVAAPAAPLKGAPAPTAKGGKDAPPAAPLSKIFPDSTASDSTPAGPGKKAAAPAPPPKVAPPKVSAPANAPAEAPKSSKTPLIIGAVVGVILLAAAVAGGIALSGKGNTEAATEDVPPVDAVPVQPIEGPVDPIGPAPPPVPGAPAATAAGVPGAPVPGAPVVAPKVRAGPKTALGAAPTAGASTASGEDAAEPKAPPPRPRPQPAEPKQQQEPQVLY